MAESEAIAAALLALGWTRATDAADCDVAILNTCTVTGEADAKNRKALRTLLRAGKAAIIVTGCAVNIDTARYADVDPRISCEHDKERIPALAVRLARDTAAVSTAISDQTTMERSDSGFRTRVDLKIQDGCDNACSYCIVHVARGPARSVPAATVISRARTLADAGTRELVLVGIDLAAYRDADIDLARLVTLLQEKTDIGRVRVSSVEPQSVTPTLVDVLAHSEGRLCRHLHLCLQSGSDKVLREMNRVYTRAHYLERVRALRQAIPEVGLTTDVIAGFPGETEAEFADTLSLVEEVQYDSAFTFIYSPRRGTRAAARPDQIPEAVQHERLDRLIRVQERATASRLAQQVGSVQEVLVEGASRRREGFLAGRTGRGMTVNFPGDAALVGKIVPVRILGTGANTLRGERA